MTTLLTAVPGATQPGALWPADPALPTGGGGGGQFVITTTPTVIASSPPLASRHLTGTFTITSATGTVYLGGQNVSATNGAAVSSTPLTVPLFSGDQVYAASGSGIVVITVLPTGV
jgi:hypothetical protein